VPAAAPANAPTAAPNAPPPGKPSAGRPLLAPGAAPAGLDKASWRNFAAGKMRATRRLDLHGHTAARAHHAVIQLVESSQAAGIRCIEIITGKGEVLARELPHWLNAPALRPLILAATPPHPANQGSLRILLRRKPARG
jgi:DNA-nicking Smr family endonuclease